MGITNRCYLNHLGLVSKTEAGKFRAKAVADHTYVIQAFSEGVGLHRELAR